MSAQHPRAGRVPDIALRFVPSHLHKRQARGGSTSTASSDNTTGSPIDTTDTRATSLSSATYIAQHVSWAVDTTPSTHPGSGSTSPRRKHYTSRDACQDIVRLAERTQNIRVQFKAGIAQYFFRAFAGARQVLKTLKRVLGQLHLLQGQLRYLSPAALNRVRMMAAHLLVCLEETDAIVRAMTKKDISRTGPLEGKHLALRKLCIKSMAGRMACSAENIGVVGGEMEEILGSL